MRWYSELTGKTYSSEARMKYAERLHKEYVDDEDKYWAKRGYIKVDNKWAKTKDVITNGKINYDNAPSNVKSDANWNHSESWIGANGLFSGSMKISQLLNGTAVDGAYMSTDDVLDSIFGRQKADFLRDYYDRHWGEL